MIVTVLLLGATPARSLAQAATGTSGPVLFENNTNLTLKVESVNYVDSAGNTVPFPGFWNINPFQRLYLNDRFNNKTYAKAFTAYISADGKKSQSLTCTSRGLDASGNFALGFSDSDKTTFLGIQQNTVTLRPNLGGGTTNNGNTGGGDPNFFGINTNNTGPTRAQMDAAVGNIIGAVIAHLVADEAVKRNPDSFFAQAAAGVALGVRDNAVREATRNLFPRLTPRQTGDVSLLITNALDGRLNLFGATQEAAKGRLINDLRTIDNTMADVAMVADFIYLLHTNFQNRRR